MWLFASDRLIQKPLANFTDNEVLDNSAASGQFHVGKFEIGDLKFELYFGVTQKLYNQLNFDGKLSLGWLNVAEGVNPLMPKNSTVIRRLLQWFPEDQKLYTVWLDKFSMNAKAQLTFGGLDADHCDSSIQFVPFPDVTSIFPSYKVFQLDSFSYSNFKLIVLYDSLIAVGYPALQLPSEVYDLILRQLSPQFDWSSGFLTVDCNSDFADFRFEIGGRIFAVPQSEFVLDLQLADNKCVLAIAKREIVHSADEPPTILGNPFLRSGHCVVFDVSNDRIGFTSPVQ
ncbi:Peptidase A1 domain-containing protein [Aphelenchoides besseyi]|nr:Peptidase A1 domain-containing protein [Aphelenchoides besseyi]